MPDTNATNQKKNIPKKPEKIKIEEKYLSAASRTLQERYHRRTTARIEVEVDKPVVLSLENWTEFVGEQTGLPVTLEMAIEDICREYTREHPEFQNWLRSRPPLPMVSEKNNKGFSTVGSTNNGNSAKVESVSATTA